MTAFPDSHRDLLDAQVATLATIDRDGFPQLTEVWFLYDEGEIRLSLNMSRCKTRNLMARPECSILILDLEGPHRYLEVRGRARIEPDDDYVFADKVARSTAAPTCARTTAPASRASSSPSSR